MSAFHLGGLAAIIGGGLALTSAATILDRGPSRVAIGGAALGCALILIAGVVGASL